MSWWGRARWTCLAWVVAGCLGAGCAPLGLVDAARGAGGPRTLAVELLALDLSTCGRCTGTERQVKGAIRRLRPVFARAGVELRYHGTLVRTAEQATALRLRTSPTLRVNGRDVPVELRESPCSDCTALGCAGASAVDCRVWVWRGREYVEAPEGLILDALLRSYAGAFDGPPESAERFELPENLRKFFASRPPAARQATRPCCAPRP
ncbi:MAG: DUF2703 domain-containing protein [Planctomycetes bacterium]|nr:DUF2703 domain-containing protein [Planctomycetota bacterium]